MQLLTNPKPLTSSQPVVGVVQVPDLRIAATPLFTSVSVTAERWVDLEEVPVAQLPLWLSHARARVGAVSWHQHTSVVWRG